MEKFTILDSDEVVKDQYNGTVHYAPNGNLYGYHWYLKAVLKEWDILVEDEYQSAMPIIKAPLTKEQYDLIPSLGPYSIRTFSPERMNRFLESIQDHNQSSYYPINDDIDSKLYDNYKIEYIKKGKIDFIDSYDSLKESYKNELANISDSIKDNLKIDNPLSPEKTVDLLDYKADKEALMRIMYNAMHRGIGFSSHLSSNGKSVGISFFVVTHNTLYEICHYSERPEYRMILLDLLFRQNAGKPMKLITYATSSVDSLMGIEPFNFSLINVKTDRLSKIKSWLSNRY